MVVVIPIGVIIVVFLMVLVECDLCICISYFVHQVNLVTPHSRSWMFSALFRAALEFRLRPYIERWMFALSLIRFYVLLMRVALHLLIAYLFAAGSNFFLNCI